MQRVSEALRKILRGVLAAALVLVLAAGGFVLLTLDEGSKAAGGGFYIVVFTLVIAGGIWRAMRRHGRPREEPGPMAELIQAVVTSTLDSRRPVVVDPPTNEEIERIREMMRAGLSMEEASRLARGGFAWMTPEEKEAYLEAVERRLA